MIVLDGIEKYYGSTCALQNVSFSIENGNIVGLLGRNGAGKSTLMNIITGYLSATSGTVTIDGLDLNSAEKEYKEKIGFLPEKPPVYENMTVTEFLEFAAKLRGVPKADAAAKTAHVIEETGLEKVAKRLIRNLSKGYQQRVGIAQAMVAEPEILILDEPTVGLDPTQVVEVRALLKKYGRDHIVIISSHILSEIGEICDRIVILNEGTVIKDSLMSEIQKTGTEHVALRIEAPEEEFRRILEQELPNCSYACKGVREQGSTDWEIRTLEAGRDIRRELYRIAGEQHLVLLEMYPAEAEIEEVFLNVTAEDHTEVDRTEEAPADNVHTEDRTEEE